MGKQKKKPKKKTKNKNLQLDDSSSFFFELQSPCPAVEDKDERSTAAAALRELALLLTVQMNIDFRQFLHFLQVRFGQVKAMDEQFQWWIFLPICQRESEQ